MDLREEILKEHSKQQTNKIIRWVGSDQKRFDQLAALFLNGEYRITQRAGWPLSYIAVAHPELVKKHLKKLILNLRKPGLHDAVLRNTVRLLQFIQIPKALQGLTADICFQLLRDTNQPVAIRVFSMSVLGNLCLEHPELKQELILSIQEQLPYASGAFIARAKMVTKKLKRI